MAGHSGFGGWLSAPRGRWLLGLAVTAAIAAAGVLWWNHSVGTDDANEPASAASDLFLDMTHESGIQHTYRNGSEANLYAILESLGGGVAFFDYDGDGLLDVFLTGGGYFEVDKGGGKSFAVKGHPCKLYKNLGGFRFKDVTREVGLDKIDFYTHGCAVGDFNRDGWPDLLVTGWGRVALFKNVARGGGRAFQDVTLEARLTPDAGFTGIEAERKKNEGWWTTSAAWVDLKGDGYPDLYICQYVDWSPLNNPHCSGYSDKVPTDVCAPGKFKGREHLLFRNNGDGTFTNISRSAGLNVYGKMEDRGGKMRQAEVGKGLGVIAVDLNLDGRPEIYVANDTVDKLLYLNHTRRRFFGRAIRLQESAYVLGVAADRDGMPSGSMGLTVADFDRQGLPSLFVTNYEGEMHSLYKNHGGESFSQETENLGLNAIGQTYVAFGTWFLDLENRGWEDIVIANGHVIRHPHRNPIAQRPVLFRNEKGKHFDAITGRGGTYFRTAHIARGLAAGDLDNDGRLDLAISHLNEPVSILRNVAGESGRRHHWLGLELVGRGHRDIVGSRIVVEAGGARRTRFVVGGGSYLSASDPRHIFGLADLDKIDRVTIYWSWGAPETFDGAQFQTDRYWLIREGRGKAEPWLPPKERQ
jgi:hypothetical protein